MSPCTADDKARFHPIEERSVNKVQNLFEKQLLYCIDEQLYYIDLYGNWISETNYAAYDIKLIPCTIQYTAYDGTVQVSQLESEEYEKMEYYDAIPSVYAKWPTKENPTRYKINSFWI